jgi:ribosomal protein S18 acetylase RimI-like enzyme
MQLVFGEDRAIGKWVMARIPHASGAVDGCYAIGVHDGRDLVAGVVYSGFTEGNCEMSIAAVTPRWAQRGVIRALLHYPLVQCELRRVTAMVPHDATRTLRFLRGVGFKQEGTLRDWFAPRRHGAVMSFMRRDFDRLFAKRV